MVTQVEDQVPRNQYVATAGQTIFPYVFQIFVKTDITVEQGTTTLTVDVDYTVSDVGEVDGGNITLTSGATVGDIITIYRTQGFDRETDYQEDGDFLSGTVNDDFNRIILMLQQNREELSRTLQYAVDDIVSDNAIPVLADRKSKVLGFDSAGDLIVQSITDGSFTDQEAKDAVDRSLTQARYNLGTTAAASSHNGISVGHIIQTNYLDSNLIPDSGGRVYFTGTTTLGKASDWPNLDDGFFYDIDGKQNAALGRMIPERWGAFGDKINNDTPATIAMYEFLATQLIGNAELPNDYLMVTPAANLDGIGIKLDERHNKMVTNFSGGTLVNGNTTSGTWSFFGVEPQAADCEDIWFINPTVISNAVSTADDAADNAANDLTGDFTNGINFITNDPHRLKNCGIQGTIKGFKMGNNVVFSDSAENLRIDDLYAEQCAQHAIGATATDFGAMSGWAADFKPSVHVGSIRGFNTKTLFDFSTVGDAKTDSGENAPVFTIGTVYGHNITSRTKIHGHWLGHIDNAIFINDTFATSPIGRAAIDVANDLIAGLSIGNMYVENFAKPLRVESIAGNKLTIGTLHAKNCMNVMVRTPENLQIGKLIGEGCGAVFDNTSTAFYSVTVGEFLIKNFRLQKYDDFLTANPTLWTGETLPSNGIINFGTIDGLIKLGKGTFEDCGGDTGDTVSAYPAAVQLSNASSSSVGVLDMDDIDFIDPPDILITNLIKAEGTRTVNLDNVNEKVACATGRYFRNNSSDITLYMSNCEEVSTVLEPFKGTLARMGDNWFWSDSTDRLRIATAKPTAATIDSAGTVVGTQT